MSDYYAISGYWDEDYSKSKEPINESINSIKFSIYFTNHLNKKTKIDDKIVSIEDGILEIDNLKLYNSLVFIVNNLYFEPSIIGDLIDRIEVKYQIDEQDAVSEYFVIDSIDFLLDNNIKVYTKSKTIQYSYKYSGNQNKLVQSSSLKELIDKLMPTTTIDHTNLTDIPFIFDYTIENKSIEEVISELQKITLYDYYFCKGVLYFEDKKNIKEDDISIQKFTSLNDIIELNTSINKDDKKINKVLINEQDEKILASVPTITLDIKDSPQPCSPNEIVSFNDEDTLYKVSPVNAYYIVYFSPTTALPTINMNAESGDRIVIERYVLERDNNVTLVGGINQILAVEGVSNYSYKAGYNLLTFDFVEAGELKITYKTTVLHGTVGHQKYPRDMSFNIQHFDQQIKHIHQIEMNGYYPIPYDFTLNLVSDWGIDYADAIDGTVKLSKYEDGSPNFIANINVDMFAETTFNISIYGTYRFDRDGQDALFLDWYINKKRFYQHEMES